MKLLILTQAVNKNDPILGFFHRWVEEFGQRFEKVAVVCLEKGEYNLPENVKVFSLGKEGGKSVFKYVFRFYKYIWKERKEYDTVFVHMNPEYVVLGSLLWRLWHKKISLWYVHRQTNFKLWLAEKLSHTIFTSSLESFRIQSRKVRYVGHGIPIEPLCGVRTTHPGKLTLLHVGRVTPIKRCEVLLEAAVILKKSFANLKVVFAGDTVMAGDRVYLESLKNFIRENGLEQNTEFLGNITGSRVREEMCKSDATINLAPTGGMDKAVLESLSLGVPVFFANEAFNEVVKERLEDFNVRPATPEVLAQKISTYFSSGKEDISSVSDFVREYFSVPALIDRIVKKI